MGETPVELEIAHVLFVDIVGYSKLPLEQQRASLDALTAAVRTTPEFQTTEAAGRILKLPTRDERQLVQTLIAKNPIDAMPSQMNLARLYSQSGEHASAIRELTTFLHLPSLQNAGELRINPAWDPLRKDPEFQKLSNAVPAK